MTRQPLVMRKVRTSWKAVAIILALMLAAVLIYTAIVVSGVMKLGLSLL